MNGQAGSVRPSAMRRRKRVRPIAFTRIAHQRDFIEIDGSCVRIMEVHPLKNRKGILPPSRIARGLRGITQPFTGSPSIRHQFKINRLTERKPRVFRVFEVGKETPATQRPSFQMKVDGGLKQLAKPLHLAGTERRNPAFALRRSAGNSRRYRFRPQHGSKGRLAASSGVPSTPFKAPSCEGETTLSPFANHDPQAQGPSRSAPEAPLQRAKPRLPHSRIPVRQRREHVHIALKEARMDVLALCEAKHQFVHIKPERSASPRSAASAPEPLGLRKHLGFFFARPSRASGEKGVKSPLKLDPGRLAPAPPEKRGRNGR